MAHSPVGCTFGVMTTSQQLMPGQSRSMPRRCSAAPWAATRSKGMSRTHAESDLRVFLTWCAVRGLGPLAAQRPHIERCPRWMQDSAPLKPSTVSRRTSIVVGFYRTCVIDRPHQLRYLADMNRRSRVSTDRDLA
jgi:integrase/recombinase XerD